MSAALALPLDDDDGFTPHRLGKCPVPKDRTVIVKYRNGRTSPVIKAEQRRWGKHSGQTEADDWDVVAWKLA